MHGVPVARTTGAQTAATNVQERVLCALARGEGPRQDQFARGCFRVGQTWAFSAIFKAFGVELAAINSLQTTQ